MTTRAGVTDYTCDVIFLSSSSFFAIRWYGANRPALMAGYLLGNQARPGEGRGGVWTMQVDR